MNTDTPEILAERLRDKFTFAKPCCVANTLEAHTLGKALLALLSDTDALAERGAK